jgi:PAS domain S-box-containing protein
VYRDDKGKVLGVFAAARDITALKQASEYARSLIEASIDPLVTISPEGKITDVNKASVEVTGLPREQLIGTDFSDYFTEPDKARAGYQQVFSQGFVRDYPLAIRHTSGRITDVLYNASVYRDDKGRVLGVFDSRRLRPGAGAALVRRTAGRADGPAGSFPGGVGRARSSSNRAKRLLPGRPGIADQRDPPRPCPAGLDRS